MLEKRGSGVLLHISSLPGNCGIGDLGSGAERFVDFLAETGQSFWQILPTGPGVGVFDHSPYMSLSAFAGNPLLISPERLVEAGLVDAGDIVPAIPFSEYEVDYDRIVPYKEQVLAAAFKTFLKKGADGFESFCCQESWLDDFAFFMALREESGCMVWSAWPRLLAEREPGALTLARQRLAERILYYKFEQFLFAHQWEVLHRYARQRGIRIIGDIPIYVGYDSADVWAHQDHFVLHERTLMPTHVAGVPPDYFSATGQRWGNPLYRWKVAGKKNKGLYGWWRNRFLHIFRMVDVVRIDHFRGFEAFWAVPAAEKTAVNGRWVRGPGKYFFEIMTRDVGGLPIIAEDLGLITPEVLDLRDSFGFPGMKILQFAFDSDAANSYLPCNYESPNCVVYTGTHDNDTTLGWYFSPLVTERAKARARRYAGGDGSEIHWDFIRMAFASVARLAIIPMQDLLGFGGDCRMNTPGTRQGNWRWRLAERFVTDGLRARLLEETIFYGRATRGNEHEDSGV